MCGIFGICLALERPLHQDLPSVREAVDAFFLLSEARGRDATGLALVAGEQAVLYKEPATASRFVKSPAYADVFAALQGLPEGTPLTLLGQARMLTNGDLVDSRDNQPIARGDLVAVHNGIIVNDAALWRQNKDLVRRANVDSEIFAALMERDLGRGLSHRGALAGAFQQIKGATTLAYTSINEGITGVGTNNGSLYWTTDAGGSILIFSSERVILERALRGRAWPAALRPPHQLGPGEYLFWDESARRMVPGDPRRPAGGPPRRRLRSVDPRLKNGSYIQAFTSAKAAPNADQLFAVDQEKIDALRRCAKCILPETFPRIVFDGEGVCNYCREYKPLVYLGADALRQAVEARRSASYPHGIVSLSGGRDSSYALHYAVQELGLKPIAYTYDWGMITDLARRNISRLCGKLGVEHVIIAADIARKRRNVRQNILAWLKKPSLGTVPLLMAGDKPYFYYANKLMGQYKTDLLVMAENRLERTHFKHGFCGVRHRDSHKTAYDFGLTSNLAMLAYYLREFAANPAYVNSSLLDTAWGYASYYLIPHRYLYLFNYIPWDEKTLVGALKAEYGWETAEDTETSWRIGDATAAFYNYIYHRLAGFSEHDTFLSNQIREGSITRDEALAQSRVANRPRPRSIGEYLGVLGLDTAQVIREINQSPPLY